MAWVLAFSPDTNPNPVGNRVLMALSWWAGGALFGLGLRAAAASRSPCRHPGASR